MDPGQIPEVLSLNFVNNRHDCLSSGVFSSETKLFSRENAIILNKDNQSFVD